MGTKLWYLSLSGRSGDGAHTHVTEIVAGLEELGWDVSLFEPRFESNTPGRLIRIREFVGTLLRARRAMRSAAQGGVLYIRAHPLTLPVVRFARRRGIKIVSEVNGPEAEIPVVVRRSQLVAAWFRRLRRRLLRASDGAIAASGQIRDEVAGLTPAPVALIPSGANTDLFRPGAETGLELPDRYVVFFGALARWQGIETILAAVRHPDWPHGVEMVVAGDGALRRTVELAAAADLIRYLGVLPQGELAGVVAGAEAGLSVQNSVIRRDALPQKLFETMSTGIPVIATDHPTQNRLVAAEECGVVIPSEDPAALARAIAAVTDDPDRRAAMGRRGRAVVVREHSWKRRASDTAAFLGQVLDGSPGDPRA